MNLDIPDNLRKAMRIAIDVGITDGASGRKTKRTGKALMKIIKSGLTYHLAYRQVHRMAVQKAYAGAFDSVRIVTELGGEA